MIAIFRSTYLDQSNQMPNFCVFVVLQIKSLSYGRCTYGHCCIHGRHSRKVGSIGLFLNLSKSGFIHGAYGDEGVHSFEFIRMHL